MFLTVWLRRQEIDYHRTRVLVTGLADVIAQKNDNTVKAFDEYREALFPFVTKAKGAKDRELTAMMTKEVEKGSVTFSAVSDRPIREAAARYQMPDEFREKLRESSERRKQRRK